MRILRFCIDVFQIVQQIRNKQWKREQPLTAGAQRCCEWLSFLSPFTVSLSLPLCLSITFTPSFLSPLSPALAHSLTLLPPPFGGTWGPLSHTTPTSTLLSLSLFPMFYLFSHYPPLPAHPEDVYTFKNNQRLPSLLFSPTALCFIIPRFPSCFKSLTQTSAQAQQCLPLGYSCQAFQLARTLPHNSWHGATNRNKLRDSGRGGGGGGFIPLEGYHRLSLL